MKNRISLLLIGVSLLVATADASKRTRDHVGIGYESGAYMGATLGGSYVMDKITEGDDHTYVAQGKGITAGAVDGGLYLGYLWCVPNSPLAIALEHDSVLSSYSKKWTAVDATNSYSGKISNHYTASLITKIGCIVEEMWFPYALIGVSAGRFSCKVDSYDTSGGTLDASGSKTVFVPGVTYGIGLEKQFMQHWRLGFELKGTHYVNKKVSPYNLGTVSFGPDVFSAGIRLSYAF